MPRLSCFLFLVFFFFFYYYYYYSPRELAFSKRDATAVPTASPKIA